MTSEEFRTNPLFLRDHFKTQGVFEIPVISRSKISLDDISLIGYDKLSKENTDKIVHFFLDDYKFETIWKDPEGHVEKLKKYKAVLSPQFSLYTEMPLAFQAYNVFRSRWCGAFLQSKGIKVIPSLVWGEPDTFWFCFDGVPKGSIVAVSTVGMRREKDLCMQGYKEMQKRNEPSGIICYGEPFEEMTGKVIRIDYAETNNLSKWFKQTGKAASPIQGKTDIVTFINIKGGGSAGETSGRSLPLRGRPNSRQSKYKEGKLVTERYFDEVGRASKDIDYTDHGNPKQHPKVPHEHTWDWTNSDKPTRSDET